MTEHKYTDDELIKAIDSIKTNDFCTLQEICDFMSEHPSESYAMCIRIERVEAIKEFAERLKEKLNDLARLDNGGTYLFLVSKNFIDELVKEFTEEKK